MSLHVTSRSGNTIDEVGLAEGALTYRTGAAREIFETMRGRMEPGLTDEDLYALMTGWTNGYISAQDQEPGQAQQ